MHLLTKELRAIKIIKKESMSNSDIELVKGEIDIMKLCRHPNIVQLFDHFENSDYIFIIMEYLKGGDLEQYLNKINFRVTENRARSIINQIASGIKYLHEYGILHRDLKPENIMLTENTDNGIIKIMDFGLSKILGPDEKVTDGFGTLSFVAPEVLIRQPYNRQIDIWSVGVILYYMLSLVYSLSLSLCLLSLSLPPSLSISLIIYHDMLPRALGLKNREQAGFLIEPTPR